MYELIGIYVIVFIIFGIVFGYLSEKGTGTPLDCPEYAGLCALVWPVTLVGLVIIGVGYLPTLLGRAIFLIHKRKSAKECYRLLKSLNT